MDLTLVLELSELYGGRVEFRQHNLAAAQATFSMSEDEWRAMGLPPRIEISIRKREGELI